MKIERKEVIDFLNAMEVTYPIESWETEGLNLWPALKSKLFFSVYNTVPQSYINAGARQVKRNPLTFFNKAIGLLSSYLPTSRTDILFIGNEAQNAQWKNKQVNRWIYPLEQFYKKERKARLYLSLDSNNRKNSLKTLLRNYKFRKKIKSSISPTFRHLEDVVNATNQKFGIGLEANSIAQYLGDILLNKKIFLSILQDLQPAVIFETTYYSSLIYALNAAASELGIPTVDIQHGGQGDQHIAYSQFISMPSQGYDLLPKHFWCWDDNSAEVITSSLSSNQVHQAHNLGNPWIAFKMNDDSRTEKQNSTKVRILYTMQYPLLEKNILGAIEKTKDKWEWWLRVHPTKKGAIPEIRKQLEEINALESVNIENATDMDLVDVLKDTDVHISRFSGSIIEASQMGVYSVITDEIGVSTYSAIIENGQAYASLGDADELLSTIEEVLKKEPLESGIPDQIELQNKFLEKFL